MLKKLYILAMLSIPFSDFYALLPLGELQHELSTYVFFLLMGLMVAVHLKNKALVPVTDLSAGSLYEFLPKLMVVLLAIIAFSFVMNFPDMFHSSYRGRLPINKFVTSTLVVFYGFGVAFVSCKLGDKYSWRDLVVWPITLSVVICMAFSAIEMLAWHGGVTEGLYRMLSRLVHVAYIDDGVSGDGLPGTDFTGRSRSVCFEPPALANFAGFAWPWVYAGFQGARRKYKSLYLIALLLCTTLIIVAYSRTSYVLLLGNIGVLILLKLVYLPQRMNNPRVAKMVSLFIQIGAVLALGAIIYESDAIVARVLTTNNDSTVSNITRLSSMTAAFHMFFARPIWGFGFGQYGFHVLQFLPPWAYQSWEVRVWFEGSTFGDVWPPVFSIYGRFAAELGILGLVTWVALWVLVARYIWKLTLQYQRLTGELFTFSYPLIMSCYCALFSGIALDSLRTPMMWVSLGLAACYVHDLRLRLIKLERNPIPAAQA
ncbi:MAG TPA: O-antigen ligase family protein [Alphaproteobacteria bacterium]|nr:O-antigen ligase family protein [Alphaproteobacteria bacterium]